MAITAELTGPFLSCSPLAETQLVLPNPIFLPRRTQSGPSKVSAGTLQDAARPLSGKEKKVVDIFSDLTVWPHLVVFRIKLLNGKELLSVQKKACIADFT